MSLEMEIPSLRLKKVANMERPECATN